jgi:hypothetical protein
MLVIGIAANMRALLQDNHLFIGSLGQLAGGDCSGKAAANHNAIGRIQDLPDVSCRSLAIVHDTGHEYFPFMQ